jgi:hypothetical protein
LRTRLKGCEIGYALGANSREGVGGVDAYTVAAPDAIAAFAVPNPGSSSRGSRFFRVWWLSELPRQADHPAYFGSVSVTGPILSTVDNSTLLLPKPECSDVDHKSYFRLFI